MEKIRVKNYRSILDSQEITLFPITAIVGRNSSGKSSFVRIFPLLKQTVEKRVSEPILWYGDYVDLGEYEQAKSYESDDNGIEIALTIHVYSRRYFWGSTNDEYLANIKIVIRKEYVQSVEISIADQCILFDYESNGKIKEIKINADNTILDTNKLRWVRREGGLLPLIVQEMDGEDNKNAYWSRFEGGVLLEKVARIIFGRAYSKKSSSFPLEILTDQIVTGNKQSVLECISRIKIGSLKAKETLKKYSVNNKKFVELNNYVLAAKIPNIIEGINDAIALELRNTNYVKPIRAMVNRFYRVQGVNIEELDSDGSNLPMILYNMSSDDLKEFEKWSKEKFGVVFTVESSVGHVSLVIKENLDSVKGTNLADTGYGYSQMLPIVVLLWMIQKKYAHLQRNNLKKTIVIEQPELHLHPAYQAKMIDVFVNIVKEAKDNGIDLKIVFETHSEVMINRLGCLIEKSKMPDDWVSVLIFDKENQVTNIRQRRFNSKGLLRGWPMGFFAADEVE